MRFLAVSLILLAVVCPLNRSISCECTMEQDQADLWVEERAERIAGDFLRDMQLIEAQAIKLLSGEAPFANRPRGAYHATRYLGAIRSVKAVPVLCERLSDEQQAVLYNELVDDRLKYPASAALVSIGTPGVQGLLRKIGTSDTTEAYQKIALGVLVEVLGKDKVARAIDEFQIEKEPGGQRKRLDALKKGFQDLYKG